MGGVVGLDPHLAVHVMFSTYPALGTITLTMDKFEKEIISLFCLLQAFFKILQRVN